MSFFKNLLKILENSYEPAIGVFSYSRTDTLNGLSKRVLQNDEVGNLDLIVYGVI